MAKRELKNKALELRTQGMSYSQIKERIPVAKSTLSVWLKDYPLSEERIRELRSGNERQIERCRQTKARKKQDELDCVYRNVSKEIDSLNKREMFIAGLFIL